MSIGSFRRDRRGNFTVMAALMMPVLLGFAALGVDVGSLHLDRKALKGATDLAVIAAAGDTASAAERVQRVLAANGFPATVHDIQLGTYTPDPERAPAERFVASGEAVNAVRLEVAERSPAFFARIFGIGDFPIRAISVAALRPTVSFSLTSQLASLDGGALNAVLTSALGAEIELDLLDSQRLAGADLTLGHLVDALAPGTGPADSVAAVLSESIHAKAFLSAVGTALRRSGDGPAAAIFDRLSEAVEAGALSLKASELIALQDADRLRLGYPAPALDLDLNAFDVLAATVGAGARHRAAIVVEHDLFGLAGLTLEILLGEAERSTPPIAVGGAGTTLHTSQLRARMTLGIGTSGILARLASVELPLQILAGSGRAELTEISCGGPDGAENVSLAVTPGLIEAAIGDFSRPLAEAAFGERVRPARLVSAVVGLVEIEAAAKVAMSDIAPTSLSFDAAEIAERRVKTVRTQDFTRSLVRDLFADLEIEARVLGLPLLGLLSLGSRSEIENALATQLGALAEPLDGVLGGLTGFLGVGLGEAHVRVNDVRCGTARLVL